MSRCAHLDPGHDESQSYPRATDRWPLSPRTPNMPRLPRLKTPRKARIASLALTLVLVVVAAPAASATGARVMNVANLDDGTCGKIFRSGLTKTASAIGPRRSSCGETSGLSSYNIFIDGAFIGKFNSDGFANVCITTTTRLVDGPHTLTGNELAPHNTYTVTPFNFSVDTVPPAPPTRPVISGFSDSGIQGDSITKYRGANFTGTSDPNVSIQLYSGVVGVGGAKADATGHWSVTTTQLADGNYTITAVALDAAGNRSSLSMSVTLTIDGTPPGAPPAPTLDAGSDSAPVGDNTTTIRTPRVNGTGALGMWRLTVYVDAVQVGTATPDAAGNWSFTLPSPGVRSPRDHGGSHRHRRQSRCRLGTAQRDDQLRFADGPRRTDPDLRHSQRGRRCARLVGPARRRIGDHVVSGDSEPERRGMHDQLPRLHDRRPDERHELLVHRHRHEQRRDGGCFECAVSNALRGPGRADGHERDGRHRDDHGGVDTGSRQRLADHEVQRLAWDGQRWRDLVHEHRYGDVVD